MTATVTRPAPRTPAPDRTPPRPPARAEPSPLIAVGAELTLVAVTVAAALGLARLFADGSFAGPVVAAALAGHAVAGICRRKDLGLLSSALVSAGGLILTVAWFVEPHTTALLIPRGATWRAVVDDLREAWAKFGDVKAPTPPLRGFVLAAVVGVWITAATSDFFAFRMRARFEAMAPAFTLFVFGAILGADNLRLPSTALYFAALLAFMLWSEAARQARAGSWFAGRAREGDTALLRQGAKLGLAAVALALVIGPHLPGAGSGGLVSWRDTKDGSNRSRLTVSPLVDIRGRLVDESNIEVFTVQSDSANYWRLTSLDRFDGQIWSSLGTYQPTRGTLPNAVGGRAVQQSYAIGNLDTIWLPAAYRPREVAGAPGARFDRDSGSLLADAETANDLRYAVVSAVPDLTAAQLATATVAVPPDLQEHYLALPQDFPLSIVDEAQRVTFGAANPYEKAKRLQDYFRSSFRYDLEVKIGHGSSAMEQFLFTLRAGYCEQFAGTYAAMARAVGLPARVAVGFVPGTMFSDGRYHVAGRDAHAWPEVYIGGYGWVAFEPTPGPGRDAPGTEAYTGVGLQGNGEGSDGTTTTTPTTTANDPTATTEPRPVEDDPQFSPTGGQDPGRSGIEQLLLVLVVAAAIYVVGVPVARRVTVERRRRRATTPSERVLVSWQEAEDALALAGHPRRPSETAPEFAARTQPAVRTAAPQLVRLAADTSAAGFSATGLSDDAVGPAHDAATAVTVELRAQASPARRLRWALDPRPLLEAARTRLRQATAPRPRRPT